MNFKFIRHIVLVAVNVLVWGYFIWSGLDGMEAIRSQHAAGYPNAGQFHYYVEIPALMFVVALLPPLILWRTGWAILGSIWLVLTLLAVPPYLFFYTGGI